MEGISVQPLPTFNLSVMATSSIPASTVVARVPLHLCIYAQTAYHCPRIGQCLRAMKERGIIDDRTATCLFLAQEYGLGEESQWASYLSILPHTFTTSLQHNKDQFKLLQSTQLGALTAFTRQDIKSTFEKVIQAVLQDQESFGALLKGGLQTADRYQWAHMVWWSRAFEVPGAFVGLSPESGKDVHVEALVPVLDLFNHTNEPSIRWGFEPVASLVDHCIQISTRDEPVSDGEQMWNCYGKVSNGQLLLQYGFTLPDNEHDSVVLSPRGFSKEGPLSENSTVETGKKVELLSRFQLDTFLVLTRETTLRELLVWAKVWCLGKSDEEGWKNAQDIANGLQSQDGAVPEQVTFSAFNDKYSVVALGVWLQKMIGQLESDKPEASDMHTDNIMRYKEGQTALLKNMATALQDVQSGI